MQVLLSLLSLLEELLVVDLCVDVDVFGLDTVLLSP